MSKTATERKLELAEIEKISKISSRLDKLQDFVKELHWQTNEAINLAAGIAADISVLSNRGEPYGFLLDAKESLTPGINMLRAGLADIAIAVPCLREACLSSRRR